MAKTVNRDICYGSLLTWGELVGSGGADITTVTYTPAGDAVASYAVNGVTWTMGYNTDGTPATETSGGLTRTYNYTAGLFTGLSGTGVGAGNRNRGTWANRPTAALDGDSYFATDIGTHGILMQWSATYHRWVPQGNQMFAQVRGNPTTPASNTHSNSNASGSLAFKRFDGTTQLIPSWPASSLGDGSRIRVTFKVRRTGIAAPITIYWKWGTFASATDASVSSTVIAASASPTACNYQFEFGFNGTVVECSGQLVYGAPQAGATNQDTVSNVINMTYTNVYALSLGTVAVTSTDTLVVTDVYVEWLC